jgi:hypothetical protein
MLIWIQMARENRNLVAKNKEKFVQERMDPAIGKIIFKTAVMTRDEVPRSRS